MFKFLKTLFRKKKNLEYLYLYIDSAEIFGDESAKQIIFSTIKNDLKQHRKELQDRYVFSNESEVENLHILGSKPLKFPWFQPLILEVYAYYKKNKDLSVFTYPFEELSVKHKLKFSNKCNNESIFSTDSNEKTIYILKFGVQC